MPDLSVIIPAYNEESRLPTTLDAIYGYLLLRSSLTFEILVIDDGSEDSTVKVVEDYAMTHPEVRVLSYQPNHGKGFAVKTGILSAKGDLLLIDDADGASPIEELERLEAAIAKGAKIAIGSRAKPDDSRKVAALAYRRFMGNAFNAIVQKLLLPGIYDTQCGFKLFRSAAGKDLFSVATVSGFGFDVEVLYIGRLRGYEIVEVPINWHNVDGSKVNLLIDSPKMFLEVLLIAVRGIFGRYKQLSKLPKEDAAAGS